MIQVNVSVNQADIAEAIDLFEFVGGNTRDAVRIGINKSLKKIKNNNTGVSIAGEIRRQVRLPARYVTGLLDDTDRATKTKLSGKVKTPARGLLLSRYSTNSKIAKGGKWAGPAPDAPARGIKVKVKPNGASKTLSREHFYMVLPNSSSLAIVRRRKTPGKEGGKIEVLYGPSVSQVFSNDTLRNVIEPAATEVYQAQLLDAMRYLLSKQYPPEI